MAYLAQHELFEQVPKLRDDIHVPLCAPLVCLACPFPSLCALSPPSLPCPLRPALPSPVHHAAHSSFVLHLGYTHE